MPCDAGGAGGIGRWRPPPPSGGEGEIRLKKLAAAVAAIAALAERLYDSADPLAVRLGLDREGHEATAHAVFRDRHAPLDAPDETPAAPGDRVTAILQEAVRTSESDLDLVFVEAELRRLALEQAGSPWAIRPGFGTPRSEDEFLHAIWRDVELDALLSSAMASAASSHVDGKRRSVDEATRLREALSRPRRRIAADEIDARVAALYARFPWCAAFLEALRRDIGRRAAMRDGAFGFSPVLLLGLPGSGKSRLAQALAEAFGAPFLRVDRAGESDAREFLGTGAGWSSERPALPTQFLAEIDVANPVMFIDDDRQGDGRFTQRLGVAGSAADA